MAAHSGLLDYRRKIRINRENSVLGAHGRVCGNRAEINRLLTHTARIGGHDSPSDNGNSRVYAQDNHTITYYNIVMIYYIILM